MTVALGLLLALLLCAGCGGEEDVGAQNDRLAEELYGELDSAAFEASDQFRGRRLYGSEDWDAPSAVDCVRPKPERFSCVTYFQVADDVALTAEYRVRDCGFGWRGLAVDAHKDLTVLAKLQHEREIETTCPWANSGSFLRMEEGD